jgi:hypothetical protein
MEKVYEAIGTIIGTIIILLLSSPIFERIKKSKLRTRFGKRMEADEEINKILSEIRSTYGFSRASLVEYHNGISSLAGFGFKHATIINESTDDITKPIILQFQNIPTSLIAKMLVALEKSQTGYLVVNEDFPDESTQITQKMYGVKQSWNFKLSNSLVDGCLSLVSNNENIELSDDDILDIKSKCQRILLIKKGFIN